MAQVGSERATGVRGATDRRCRGELAHWPRTLLIALVTAPLLIAPGGADALLVAGVALAAIPLLVGLLVLRLVDRLLPAHLALPGGATLRRAPVAHAAAILAVALLTGVAPSSRTPDDWAWPEGGVRCPAPTDRTRRSSGRRPSASTGE